MVKNTKNDEELLYKFYYTIFNSFHKHADFAKILIKEQMHSFNEEFILKMRIYDQAMDKISYRWLNDYTVKRSDR